MRGVPAPSVMMAGLRWQGWDGMKKGKAGIRIRRVGKAEVGMDCGFHGQRDNRGGVCLEAH